MGRTNTADIETGWLIFSKHRCRALESDVAARDRDDLAGVFCAAKHDSLDQIDRDRKIL